MKRRKAAYDDEDNQSSSDIDETLKTSKFQYRQAVRKQYRFDFNRDSEFQKVRGRILGSMNKEPSDSEISENSPKLKKENERFFSRKNGRFMKTDVYSNSRLDTDFKTASGRPLFKKVLPVFPDNKNNNEDIVQEHVNERRVVFNKPSVPKFGVRENKNGLSQVGKKTHSDGTDVVNKREGWKASETLKYFDNNIIDIIEAEIMSTQTNINWADVAGLESTKKALREIIVLPFLRPDIFTGIRAPPKGVLLFGPPGTGKTMIGRCVASQCKATFFNIAASSVTSKWVGEGEKLVRALFAIARVLQPSVVFIDEIDSLLTSRSESDHESSRRIKTEFLINLDGVATTSEERILILGATNRPHELDLAVKRRFVKRLYIGLPCHVARTQMILSLLSDQKHELSNEDVQRIAKLTDGFSGADMKQLCVEAAMGPVRTIVDSSSQDIASVSADEIRPICLSDFEAAMRFVRPTVSENDLEKYREWNKQFGSFLSE